MTRPIANSETATGRRTIGSKIFMRSPVRQRQAGASDAWVRGSMQEKERIHKHFIPACTGLQMCLKSDPAERHADRSWNAARRFGSRCCETEGSARHPGLRRDDERKSCGRSL